MNMILTEVELTAVRGEFQTLVDDLGKAGLRSRRGVPATKMVLAYARRRIGVADAISVTKEQWERFFRQVDELRFDFPGLARYIGSLSLPPAPVAEPTPQFSAADISMLQDAGISAMADSRPQVRYWKDKA